MAFDINSTRSLLGVINRAYPPNPLLVNTFFPNAITYSSEYLDVDFKKGGRSMAPFVVPGSQGVNMQRDGFETKSYKAPRVPAQNQIPLSSCKSVWQAKACTAVALPNSELKNIALRISRN